MKNKKTKKRNPTEATTRNVRAARKRSDKTLQAIIDIKFEIQSLWQLYYELQARVAVIEKGKR